MLRKQRILVAALITLVLISPTLLALTPLTGAYDAREKWLATTNPNEIALLTRQYQVDPDLDLKLILGPPGNIITSPVISNAVRQWNKASAFKFDFDPGWDPNYPALFTAQDFRQALPPCPTARFDFADVCYATFPNNPSVPFTRGYFNALTRDDGSPQYVWNTNGTWALQQDPAQIDFFTIALHEMGHMLVLQDRPAGHGEAVMWFDQSQKRTLTEDDKQGATQLYGPDTGIEEQDGEARGEINRAAFPPRTVVDPQLSPIIFENGVQPWNTRDENPANLQSKMLRLYGIAQSNYSYSYQTLFTGQNNAAAQPADERFYWLRVQPGMELQWCQYNWRQSTMTIDLQFTDGSTLRDSGLQDRGGRSVHPAQRGGIGTGFWFCPTVDLSPLVGRRIQRIMVAYDSGTNNNAATGQEYRAYFDEIRIVPGMVRDGQALTIGSGNIATSNQGSVGFFTPTPAGGSTFTGWRVDGAPRGWANPLSVTMNPSHAVTANFVQTPTFCDVSPSDPYYTAVTQLAARGIIRGAGGCYNPGSTLLRAQVAALITRSIGWDEQNWGNPFLDQNGVDNSLWRNVGALAHYDVARGYGNSQFDPTGDVLYVQSISFFTRAMVAKGYWRQQPDNPSLYPNVPATSGARGDLATYAYYAGAVPGTNPTSSWSNWNQPAPRSWFALAQWQAINSFFSVDRVP